MKEIGSIHVFEDEAFLKRITRCSVVVVVAGVLVLAVACVLNPGLVDAAPQGLLLSLLSLVFITVAALAVHELVHAFFFKIFAPKGSRVTFGANLKTAMIYACAQGIVYTRKQYLVVGLSPTVVVTALLLALGAATGWMFTFAVAAIVHLSGCVGDWGYAVQIFGNPNITHVEDTDFGVRFFGQEDEDPSLPRTTDSGSEGLNDADA